MSKSETIDALMESAIQSFSKLGYEGASLRDIARNAAVPLSTIHLYFGSKQELFDAVRQNARDELDAERSDLFEKAVAKHPPGDALLAALIHALAYPVARRALSNDPRDYAQAQLMRAHWIRMPNIEMIEIADRSITRWFDALRLCFPSLDRQNAGWALSFAVGATYSWQLLDQRYARLVGAQTKLSGAELTEDIVAFCCAGIKAMVARREREQP